MGEGIFAHHAHVFPADARPHGSVDALLGVMDECGIARAVAFAPFPRQIPELGNDRNRWLAQELATRERLVGFGTIDFRAPNVRDQVREIHDLGLLGIKIHPAAQAIHVLADVAMEVYEEATRLGLFLTFHTGIHRHRIQDYLLVHFDEIAYRFPELRFSLEHVGGYHFMREAIAVITNNAKTRVGDVRVSNVYGGLTSVFDREKHRYWYFDVETLREIIWQVGEHQLIFGLDFPYNREAEAKQALEIIDQIGLSPEGKRMVLGGNLERVLGLD